MGDSLDGRVTACWVHDAGGGFAEDPPDLHVAEIWVTSPDASVRIVGTKISGIHAMSGANGGRVWGIFADGGLASGCELTDLAPGDGPPIGCPPWDGSIQSWPGKVYPVDFLTGDATDTYNGLPFITTPTCP